MVPGTDYVRNREANNFCEDFKPITDRKRAPERSEGKKKFNSLFKDED